MRAEISAILSPSRSRSEWVSACMIKWMAGPFVRACVWEYMFMSERVCEWPVRACVWEFMVGLVSEWVAGACMRVRVYDGWVGEWVSEWMAGAYVRVRVYGWVGEWVSEWVAVFRQTARIRQTLLVDWNSLVLVLIVLGVKLGFVGFPWRLQSSYCGYSGNKDWQLNINFGIIPGNMSIQHI